MLVAESSRVGELGWGRVRREAGERGACISVCVVSGVAARWLVPTGLGTTSPSGIPILPPQTPASRGVGDAVADRLFEADAAAGPFEAIDVRVLGSAILENEVMRVLGESGLVEVRRITPSGLEAYGIATSPPSTEGFAVTWPVGVTNPATLGIGVRGDRMAVLIARGESLPRWREETFTTGDDGQTAISIRLYRGESEDCRMNAFIVRFEITTISPAPAGSANIKVRFVIADGELVVIANDSATGAPVPLTVEL